jgi:hypothetical protein
MAIIEGHTILIKKTSNFVRIGSLNFLSLIDALERKNKRDPRHDSGGTLQ